MKRRTFLTTAATAPLLGRLGWLAAPARAAEPTPAAPETAGWRRFEITTRVTLKEATGPARLWLPLAQTAGGYQTALDVRWEGNTRTARVADARYGAPILRTLWEKGNGDAPHQADSAEGRALRDHCFGFWEMNWVGFNSATDIALPGEGEPKPDFAFLMYPCARTASGPCNCLDPKNFHYEILARELTS